MRENWPYWPKIHWIFTMHKEKKNNVFSSHFEWASRVDVVDAFDVTVIVIRRFYETYFGQW